MMTKDEFRAVFFAAILAELSSPHKGRYAKDEWAACLREAREHCALWIEQAWNAYDLDGRYTGPDGGAE